MKKSLSLHMALVLLTLCGCADTQENKDTRFLLDTVVTLTADCGDEVLDGAFGLCGDYEKLFSRTLEASDVSRLNSASGPVKVSDDTVYLIKRGLWYSQLSGGAFDITICPVSMLWDFNNEIIPDRAEIAEALKNVDYNSIETDGDTVNTNGRKIDLGGIAKGFIAGRLLEYFKENGVESGIINLGGNVIVFGDREKTVGIAKPFGNGETSAQLALKNMSAATAGIYERYIERDGILYHHILDPKTGYGVESDLVSATVISESPLDGDALSTVCILFGKQKATALIEQTESTEAVFIDTDGNVTHTSGLTEEDGLLRLTGAKS